MDDPRTWVMLKDCEVAAALRVSSRTVRLWRAKGALETYRLPSGRPRTPADALGSRPSTPAQSGKKR